MRPLLAVVLVYGALGCSKCSSDKAVPDAGATSVAAVTVPDAAVDVPDAAVAASDGGLIDAYVRDCNFVVQKSYYQFDQDLRDDECIARDVDQSCAPDLFGCYRKGEECRDECGTSCQSCSTECATSCGTCRSECDAQPAGQRDACVLACAKARLECRTRCIAGRESCLIDSCTTLESTCDDESERKRRKACPDCTELGSCMWEDGFKDDHAKCLDRFPENAKECLEWCFQE